MLASFESFPKRRTDLLVSVLLNHVIFFKLFCSYVLVFPLASTWESKSHELKFVLTFFCPFLFDTYLGCMGIMGLLAKTSSSHCEGGGSHAPFFSCLKYFNCFFFGICKTTIPCSNGTWCEVVNLLSNILARHSLLAHSNIVK